MGIFKREGGTLKCGLFFGSLNCLINRDFFSNRVKRFLCPLYIVRSVGKWCIGKLFFKESSHQNSIFHCVSLEQIKEPACRSTNIRYNQYRSYGTSNFFFLTFSHSSKIPHVQQNPILHPHIIRFPVSCGFFNP